MKRPIVLLIPGLLAASLAFAALPASLSAAKIPSLTRIYLQAGKSIDGIGVNPVTHKAYVIGEQATEGDDQKAVFVLDSAVLNARSAPKKLKLPLGSTTHPPKVVPIPNENEYISIDSTRNLIYVATQFGVEENEPPDTDSGGGEVEPPGGLEPPEYAPVTAPAPATVDRGTLTVIDGNTDTVIATWYFDAGIESEGTAVDPASGMVYVGAKAPEGESANDDTCTSGTPIYDVGSPGDVECWTGGYIYAFFFNPADATQPIRWVKTIPAGDDPESVVFAGGMVYAANEDDGTVTIATAVKPNGTGGGAGHRKPDAVRAVQPSRLRRTESTGVHREQVRSRQDGRRRWLGVHHRRQVSRGEDHRSHCRRHVGRPWCHRMPGDPEH